MKWKYLNGVPTHLHVYKKEIGGKSTAVEIIKRVPESVKTWSLEDENDPMMDERELRIRAARMQAKIGPIGEGTEEYCEDHDLLFIPSEEIGFQCPECYREDMQLDFGKEFLR